MQIRLALPAVALAFATVGSRAAADVTPIPVDAGKAFKHEFSGISMPPTAAAIPRTVAEEFDDKQLDVAAEYRTADEKEITTIYVFRKVTGDVPLWFDRIQHAIEARDMFVSPRLAIPPAAFTPPGQTTASGLVAIYTPGAAPWKSTGAALATSGDWFVSIRASSQTLTPEQLLGRIRQTIMSIQWPRQRTAAPAAAPIVQCADSLRQPNEDAQPIKDDLAAMLADAVAATPDSKNAGLSDQQPSRWCRDPLSLPYAGIYRPEGAKDRYLVAFQDAGRGIWVGSDEFGDMLVKSQGQERKSYMVELMRWIDMSALAASRPCRQSPKPFG